jgi:hypothetical protein
MTRDDTRYYAKQRVDGTQNNAHDSARRASQCDYAREQHDDAQTMPHANNNNK